MLKIEILVVILLYTCSDTLGTERVADNFVALEGDKLPLLRACAVNIF